MSTKLLETHLNHTIDGGGRAGRIIRKTSAIRFHSKVFLAKKLQAELVVAVTAV